MKIQTKKILKTKKNRKTSQKDYDAARLQDVFNLAHDLAIR